MGLILPVVAIRTLLVSNADMTAFFAPSAPRVYGTPGIPRADVDGMPRMAITMQEMGSTDNASIPLSKAIIAFRCYGATALEAMQLYHEMAQVFGYMTTPIQGRRLQNELIDYEDSDCYLYSVHKVSGPMDLMQVPEEWPYVWSSWNFQHFQLTPADL